MEVELMNKNYPLLTCDIEKNIVFKVKKIHDTKHLPIMLQDNVSVDTINKWLQTRCIPEKREGLEEARKMFDFLSYKHMQSLSDQYWFRFDPRESWNKINFFTNTYQMETGKIFFEPWAVDKSKLKYESPDLTTNGKLKKRWVIKDNNVSYLIKAGSKAYNQSPISEVLASMFLKKLDIIPFVEYKLAVDGLKMCSICQNFIDVNTEFVPAEHVYRKFERKNKETIYEHVIRTSVAYGINENEARAYMDAMICADTVICNEDRHLNNFGYIRDVESGRLLGFAPLFDSGSAFTNLKNQKAKQMFRDREGRSLDKVLDKQKREYFSIESMLQMIDAYPTLDEDEKEVIRRKVMASAEKIKTGGRKKNPIAKERG